MQELEKIIVLKWFLVALYILSIITIITLLTIICIDIKKIKNKTHKPSKKVDESEEKKTTKEKLKIFNNKTIKLLIKDIVICGIIALLYFVITLIFKESKYQQQNQIIGYIVLGTILLLQIITIIYSIFISKKDKTDET